MSGLPLSPQSPAESSADVTEPRYPPPPPERVELAGTRVLKRLDWGLVTDATMSFVAMEKGFLFTMRAFLRQPRAAFESYLGAGRLRFSNPLKLVIFLVAISTFMNYQLGTFDDVSAGFEARMEERGDKSKLTAEHQAALAEFYQRHYNLMLLAALPLLATTSRLLYWKRAYNWMEHLALNGFIFAVTTVAYLVQMIPAVWAPWLGLVYLVASVSYQTWAYRRVLGPGWGRALATTVLGTSLYAVVFLLAVSAWVLVMAGGA